MLQSGPPHLQVQQPKAKAAAVPIERPIERPVLLIIQDDGVLSVNIDVCSKFRPTLDTLETSTVLVVQALQVVRC